MNTKSNGTGRVIGLDCHPDTFTAAVIGGSTPAAALVEKVFNKVPLSRLQSWAQKHTTAADIVVLEASGNSFHVVRRLWALQRQGLVLESCQMGRLKEAHANNDKISAVRIGKAYLAGTAKVVWVPDPKTQERRDWLHAHRKAVKRCTQMGNRLLSYLSDQGVRLSKNTPLTETALQPLYEWSPRQWQVVSGYLMELRHAEEQRRHWRSLMAQEVIGDPVLLSIVRLCGVRELVAFAVGAIVGDITRFSEPRKLVKYLGLNPAFDDSGNHQWHGGVGGHGRGDLRALLIQSAQAVLRSKSPLAKWGRKLAARKDSAGLAVVAIARRLTVAIWYLLMGRWTPLEEIDERLVLKVGRIITQVGIQGLKNLAVTRAELRQQMYESLQKGRLYTLHPPQPFVPHAPA